MDDATLSRQKGGPSATPFEELLPKKRNPLDRLAGRGLDIGGKSSRLFVIALRQILSDVEKWAELSVMHISFASINQSNFEHFLFIFLKQVVDINVWPL